MSTKKDLNFKKIRVVLADSDHTYRHAIYNMLRNIGLREIRQAATLGEIRAVVADPEPDLLISEAELSDGDFYRFVHALRNGAIGNNPFMAILTLTAEPTKDLVNRVVDSGSDDLLTKPMSAAQLKSRITNLINQRKPFVVTSDYIGPTRRDSEHRDSSIPLVDVPNTLREKATGIAPDLKSQENIDATFRQINLQKLNRYAEQITYLVDRIITAVNSGENDEHTQQQIKRLDFVAHDTGRRLIGTDMDHITKLCQTLIKVTERIKSNLEAPKATDMELLPPLAAAILAGINIDSEGTADFAHQISSELSK